MYTLHIILNCEFFLLETLSTAILTVAFSCLMTFNITSACFNVEIPFSALTLLVGQQEGQWCSGAGTRGNAVPVNIFARERRSRKCVSCKWERLCQSVPINISN